MAKSRTWWGMFYSKTFLDKVKASSVICLCVDEGTRQEQYLSIRVHYMDQFFNSHSAFWQMVRIPEKNHRALLDAIVDTFLTSPTSHVPAEKMLSRAEFFQKLVCLTADGASVMGTQRGGQPLGEPKHGDVGNLAWALLREKAAFSEEKLSTVWCSPHRLDLVADRLDTLDACSPLLSLVRKLCSHIEIHAKARGKLSALHKVLSGEFSGGAAELTYAPHRFLSHAGAASALSKSYVEVLLYVHAATRDVDSAAQGWAARMLETTQQLRTWLTLSAIADILQILRAANVRMHRSELRVLMVNDIVEACEVKLDDYVKEGAYSKPPSLSWERSAQSQRVAGTYRRYAAGCSW